MPDRRDIMEPGHNDRAGAVAKLLPGTVRHDDNQRPVAQHGLQHTVQCVFHHVTILCAGTAPWMRALAHPSQGPQLRQVAWATLIFLVFSTASGGLGTVTVSTPSLTTA